MHVKGPPAREPSRGSRIIENLTTRALVGLTLLAVAAGVVWQLWRPRDPLPGFPATMLYVGDRAEDLRFLDPKTAGIAYLARTVIIGATAISVQPRLSPLEYSPGATLMAVVRLELTTPFPPPLANVLPALLPAATGAAALQIDHDVAEGNHYWYYRLIADLRKALPSGKPLSVAVRPSWCSPGSWVAGLPVAEACPLR